MFAQDSAPSHPSNLVQDYLQEWLSSSPDCSPLNYYFWNKVKGKVYGNRLNQSFENEWELKKWIISVWNDIVFNLPEILQAIKQFVGGLDVFFIRKPFFWLSLNLLNINARNQAEIFLIIFLNFCLIVFFNSLFT